VLFRFLRSSGQWVRFITVLLIVHNYKMKRNIMTILSVVSLTSLAGAGIGVGSWVAMANEKV